MKLFITVAYAAAVMAAGPSYAAEVLFTITGAYAPKITFEIPQSPSPDFALPGGYFLLADQTELINGNRNVATLQFDNSDAGGGFTDSEYYYFYGPQFYTGTENNPSFVLGIYKLPNPYSGSLETITVSPVPEPTTWAFILSALGGVGAVMRLSRRPKIVVDAAA